MTVSSTGATFRYKNVAPIYAGWVILIGLSVIAIAVALIRPGAHGALIPVIGIFSIFLTFASFAALSMSDVVVDDRCISRSLFGKTWQIISWDNVRRIRAITAPDFRRGAVRSFAIVTKLRQPGNWVPKGLMSFNEKIEGAADLVALLNHYIAKHDIAIESITEQGPVKATRL